MRKISGFNKPSQANQEVFQSAVDSITEVARDLIDSLVTTAVPKNREVEAAKAKQRAAKRFGRIRHGRLSGILSRYGLNALAIFLDLLFKLKPNLFALAINLSRVNIFTGRSATLTTVWGAARERRQEIVKVQR